MGICILKFEMVVDLLSEASLDCWDTEAQFPPGYWPLLMLVASVENHRMRWR